MDDWFCKLLVEPAGRGGPKFVPDPKVILTIGSPTDPVHIWADADTVICTRQKRKNSFGMLAIINSRDRNFLERKLLQEL